MKGKISFIVCVVDCISPKFNEMALVYLILSSYRGMLFLHTSSVDAIALELNRVNSRATPQVDNSKKMMSRTCSRGKKITYALSGMYVELK